MKKCFLIAVFLCTLGLAIPGTGNGLDWKGITFMQGDAKCAYDTQQNGPSVVYKDTQYLLTSQLLADVAMEEIQEARTNAAAPYLQLPLPDGSSLGGYVSATQDAMMFQITYNSEDMFGNPTVLSGLVAVPGNSMSGGMVVYMHATEVNQTGGAPSFPSVEACSVFTAFAGEDYVVVMPDYLGYGVNNRPHPYPLGTLNAASGRDIILAARELVSQLLPGEPLGPSLYITGYSEGGGNALWLARILEEDDDASLHPTLVAPMSGNYDITGATANSLIVPQPPSLLTLAAKPLLLTFTAQATWQYTGQKPTSLIKSGLVAWDILWNKLPVDIRSTSQLVRLMATLLLSAANYSYPKVPNPLVLMQQSLILAIRQKDLTNPAVGLWAQNDNLDWSPVAPIYATGILQDQIVPFAASSYPVPANYVAGRPFFSQGNSQNLIKVMRAKGFGANQVAWCGIDGRKVKVTVAGKTTTKQINHLTGLVPVSILAARFFNLGMLSMMPQLPDPPR